MSLSTGYFAYAKRYKEMGYSLVSIARVTPKWFDGKSCKELAPTYDLLSRYKNGTVSEDDYKKEYFSMLDLIDDDTFSYILSNLSNVNSVLLCYEKSSDFCHRHLLAEYVKGRFNITILEVDIIK